MEKGGETWNENIGSMIQFCVRLYMHANNLFITNYQRCTHTQYNWINIQQINTLLYGAARRETRKSPKTPKTETLPNKETSIFNLTGHMKPVSKNIYLFDTTQHSGLILNIFPPPVWYTSNVFDVLSFIFVFLPDANSRW